MEIAKPFLSSMVTIEWWLQIKNFSLFNRFVNFSFSFNYFKAFLWWIPQRNPTAKNPIYSVPTCWVLTNFDSRSANVQSSTHDTSGRCISLFAHRESAIKHITENLPEIIRRSIRIPIANQSDYSGSSHRKHQSSNSTVANSQQLRNLHRPTGEMAWHEFLGTKPGRVIRNWFFRLKHLLASKDGAIRLNKPYVPLKLSANYHCSQLLESRLQCTAKDRRCRTFNSVGRLHFTIGNIESVRYLHWIAILI